MKGTSSENEIQELKDITLANKQFAEKKLIHLNDTQKSWRPAVDSWNLIEILAHLNAYATFYNKTIQNRIAKTKFTRTKEQFVSSPLGRSAWKSMKLGRAKNVKRKFKSPKNQNPTIDPSLVNGDEVNSFIDNQETMLGILDLSETVNLKRVKIPISISRIVRLRLGDALMFVIYHNERHIQQAMNVMAHPKFPKK